MSDSELPKRSDVQKTTANAGAQVRAAAASMPGIPAAPAPSSQHVRGAYEFLRYEEDGPVARLTLDRPAARNALSLQLSDELLHAFERLRDTDTVKIVVLQGAGKTFCAGDDMRSAREPTPPSQSRGR